MRVRTTVRSLAKEAAVRAAIAPAVDAADRLTVVVADLTKDDGWDAAVTGCDYVLHVASPLGGQTSGDANALIGPARDGTLRVLGVATRAGVKRVVMTSAAAAARPPLDSDRVSDETIWADPADPQFDAYRVSKILAERAAWDFMTGSAPDDVDDISSGAVFGPVLTTTTSAPANHSTLAERQSCRDPPPGILGGGCPRSGGSPRPRDDRARGRRAAVHCRRRVHVDGRHRANAAVTPRRAGEPGADAPPA
jgi:nucleoside-diphosphate-sugar epimerase